MNTNKTSPQSAFERHRIHVGRKFGRLRITSIKKVIDRRYSKPHTRIYFEYTCRCGTQGECEIYCILNSSVVSCGCRAAEQASKNAITHGLSKTKLYTAWSNMWTRCRHDSNYCKRSISVCPQWKKFTTFRKWALKNDYKPSLQLDRIDNDSNYEPSNCRWVTLYQNLNNRGITVKVTYQGRTQPLADWCRELNLHQNRTYMRIVNGWTPTKAFTTPARKYTKRK